MTVYVSKPEFNIRSKLNEIGGQVSYENMPSGSIIQQRVAKGYGTGSTSHTSTSFQPIPQFEMEFAPRLPNSLIKIELQIQYWLTDADVSNYGVFTVYRDGSVNLSDIPVSLDMNASYTGTSSTRGIWFGANRPIANYNDSAVVRVFDKPHTTDQIIYKPYSRMYVSGRLWWNWGSQHDSMVISEIKQ
tara:strand:+ start:1677 stop:2240 length:564 start_codon:yes stop_codon:yes gene_type:complete